MCISENEHYKDMCLKEVGLHAHNLLTTVGSTINIIVCMCVGGTYVAFLWLTISGL